MPFTPEQSSALPGPEWLRARRAGAVEALVGARFPSTDQELWRYSRVADIDLDRLVPASAPDVDAFVSPLLDAIGRYAALVVTVDGFAVSSSVDDGYADVGLVVTNEPESGEGFAGVGAAVDMFGILNEAFTPCSTFVDVPEGVVVDEPIVIVHRLSGDRIASFPHAVVRAGEASEATVCEIHISDDVSSLVAPIIEHDVRATANLSYVNVQCLGRRVHHVGYNASRVAQQATFNSTTVALGGDYARVRTDSHLDGEGADSNLRAVYFGTQSQMHDFRTLQDHHAPKTRSDLFFKGAVGDSARSVYSGLIRVDKGAAGTNAFQTNRNLVLSDGAHAESVPNLEIEENDVKCSHASAIGPINEEQRYYLESRGVPTEVAGRLIALGFLNEVLAGLPVAGLRSVLGKHIAGKLDSVESEPVTI